MDHSKFNLDMRDMAFRASRTTFSKFAVVVGDVCTAEFLNVLFFVSNSHPAMMSGVDRSAREAPLYLLPRTDVTETDVSDLISAPLAPNVASLGTLVGLVVARSCYRPQFLIIS